MRFFQLIIAVFISLCLDHVTAFSLTNPKDNIKKQNEAVLPKPPPLSEEVLDRYTIAMRSNLQRHYDQFSSNIRKLDEYIKTSGQPDYKSLANDDKHPYYAPYNQALFTAMNYDVAAASFRLASLLHGEERDKWIERGIESAKWVREHYIVPSNGKIRGYLTLAKGQLFSALVSEHDRGPAKKALKLLVDNQSFTSPDTPPEENEKLKSPELSRETAYSIINYVAAEKVGYAKSERLSYLVNTSKGHLKQWIDALKNPESTPSSWVALDSPDAYIRPFMVALSVGALQWYSEHRGDKQALALCSDMLEIMWRTCWDEGQKAFRYTDRVLPDDNPIRKIDLNDQNLNVSPQPALNSMIGMVYARQGELTKSLEMLKRGDIIVGSHISSGLTAKETNQNLFW